MRAPPTDRCAEITGSQRSPLKRASRAIGAASMSGPRLEGGVGSLGQWNPRLRVRLAALSACLAAVLACSLFTGLVRPTEPSMEGGAKVRIESAEGGSLALADGSSLEIPPGALSADVEVSLRQVEAGSATGGAGEFTMPVGSRYEVDLGGQELLGPVRLEIPFDRAALPPGEDPQHVFLTYFDEEQGEWVFAGGEPDLVRNVIVLEVDHGSWWEPATWNWEAWSAALNDILSANIVSIFEGVALLVDDCPQEGQYVSVDASRANGLVQGCVERVDAQAAELRVVNPRAIYVEVQPLAGGGYFNRTLLAPGESLRFRADTGDPSPLVVSADVTQKAGLQLAIHMTIAMLPGFNQLGFQGRTVACLTERLADVSFLVSASEALLEGNGAAAAEHIADMYQHEDVMRRFITAADDCAYGPAATWSLPGLKMVGASLATIQSSVEFVPNFLFNSHGEVVFRWDTPSLGDEQKETDGLLAIIGADWNVWLMKADGTDPRQLTFDTQAGPGIWSPLVGYRTPRWSRDGGALGVLRHGPAGNSIVVFNSPDYAAREFPLSEEGSFDWLPNGRSIVFADAPFDPAGRGNYPGGLSILDLDSGEVRPLLESGADLRLTDPDWAPAGGNVFFSVEPSPWPSMMWAPTLGLGRGDANQYIEVSTVASPTCDWAPYGDRLACGNGNMEFSGSQLVVLSTSGEELLRIPAEQSQSFVRYPLWSPDSTHVAFERSPCCPPGEMELDLVEIDGDSVSPPMTVGNNLLPVSWSPDGGRLVALSNPYGMPKVVVVDILSFATVVIRDGFFAAWQPCP